MRTKIFDRRFIRLLGAVSMALLIALALMPALQAGACTDQSPYDYGDATADGAVNVQDKSRIDAILGASQPASSTSDATADGATNVQDKSRVDAILGASQTPTDRYVAVYDFSSGAGTTHLGAYKQAAGLPAGKWTGGDPYWTNFSSGDYSDTAAIDADDLSMGANASGYNAVQARFEVTDEDVSQATHLVLQVRGKTGNGQTTDIDFYAWNANSLSWTLVGSKAMTGDSEANFSATSSWGKASMGNYIDANDYIFIMAIQDTANVALDVDYLRLQVVTTLDDVPCGAATPSPTATATATATPSATSTASPTATATATASPTATSTPTATPSATPTPTPTATPSATATVMYEYTIYRGNVTLKVALNGTPATFEQTQPIRNGEVNISFSEGDPGNQRSIVMDADSFLHEPVPFLDLVTGSGSDFYLTLNLLQDAAGTLYTAATGDVDVFTVTRNWTVPQTTTTIGDSALDAAGSVLLPAMFNGTAAIYLNQSQDCPIYLTDMVLPMTVNFTTAFTENEFLETPPSVMNGSTLNAMGIAFAQGGGTPYMGTNGRLVSVAAQADVPAMGGFVDFQAVIDLWLCTGAGCPAPTPTPTPTTAPVEYTIYRGNVTLKVALNGTPATFEQTQPIRNGEINISFSENAAGHMRTIVMDADSFLHDPVPFLDLVTGSGSDFYLTLNMLEDAAGTLYTDSCTGDVDVFTVTRNWTDPQTTITIGDGTFDSAGSVLLPAMFNGTAAIYLNQSQDCPIYLTDMVLPMTVNFTTAFTENEFLETPPSVMNGSTLNATGIEFAQGSGTPYVGTNGRLVSVAAAADVPAMGGFVDFQAVIDLWLCTGAGCPEPTPTPTPTTAPVEYTIYRGNVTLKVALNGTPATFEQTQPIRNGEINISFSENAAGHMRTIVMDADSFLHDPVPFLDLVTGSGSDFYLTLNMLEDAAGTLYTDSCTGDVDVFTVTRNWTDPQTTITIGDGTFDSAGSVLLPAMFNGTAAIYLNQSQDCPIYLTDMVLPMTVNFTTAFTENEFLETPPSVMNGSTLNATGIEFAQGSGTPYVGTNGRLVSVAAAADVPAMGGFVDFQAVIDLWLCTGAGCPAPTPTPTPTTAPVEYTIYRGNVTLKVALNGTPATFEQTQPIRNGEINISFSENAAGHMRTIVMDADSFLHDPVPFLDLVTGSGSDFYLTLNMLEDAAGTLYTDSCTGDVDVFTVTRNWTDPQTDITIGDGTFDSAGSVLLPAMFNGTAAIYLNQSQDCPVYLTDMVLPMTVNFTTAFTENEFLETPPSVMNGSTLNATGIEFAQGSGTPYVGTNGRLVSVAAAADVPAMGGFVDFQAVIDLWLCTGAGCPEPTPTPTATVGYEYKIYRGNVTLRTVLNGTPVIFEQTQPFLNGEVNISFSENAAGHMRAFVMDAASLNHTPVFFPDIITGTGSDFYLTLTMLNDSVGTLYTDSCAGDVDVFTVTRNWTVPQTTTTIGDGTPDSAGSVLMPAQFNGTAAVWMFGMNVFNITLPMEVNFTTAFTENEFQEQPVYVLNGSTLNATGIPFAQGSGTPYVGTNGRIVAVGAQADLPAMGGFVDFQFLIDWWLCTGAGCPEPTPTPSATASPTPTATTEATATPTSTATASPTPTPTATSTSIGIYFTNSSINVSGELQNFYLTINISSGAEIPYFFAAQFVLEWNCSLFEIMNAWISTPIRAEGQVYNGSHWINTSYYGDIDVSLSGTNPQCPNPAQGRAPCVVSFDGYYGINEWGEGVTIPAGVEGTLIDNVRFRTYTGEDFKTGTTDISFVPTLKLSGFKDGSYDYESEEGGYKTITWTGTSVTVE